MQVENYRNILVSRKICEKKEAQYFSFAILERECKKFIFSNYLVLHPKQRIRAVRSCWK